MPVQLQGLTSTAAVVADDSDLGSRNQQAQKLLRLLKARTFFVWAAKGTLDSATPTLLDPALVVMRWKTGKASHYQATSSS